MDHPGRVGGVRRRGAHAHAVAVAAAAVELDERMEGTGGSAVADIADEPDVAAGLGLAALSVDHGVVFGVGAGIGRGGGAVGDDGHRALVVLI